MIGSSNAVTPQAMSDNNGTKSSDFYVREFKDADYDVVINIFSIGTSSYSLLYNILFLEILLQLTLYL